MNYTREPFTSKLFRVNLKWILSELPTELEALRESPELTVKTETFGYVNITYHYYYYYYYYEQLDQWNSSDSDQHNSLLEEFSTSIASFWVTISLLLIFVLISLILSFLIFIIIYAIIVIVINHLMSYVDVYTEAVVISMFKEWHVMY